MMLDQRSALSSYMTRLLSEGRVVFTAAQAQKALRIGKGALLDTAEKQQRRKYLRPLLTPTESDRITKEAMKAAFSSVFKGLVGQLPGNPWARTDEMTERFELDF